MGDSVENRLVKGRRGAFVLAATISGSALCADLPDLPDLGEEPGKGRTSGGAGAPHEMSLEEISAKLDNPLSDLWLIWMQNDRMRFNGDLSSESRSVDVKYFEPVISLPITEKWNLVNRPVVTRIDAELPDIDLPQLPGAGFGGTRGGGGFVSGGLVDLVGDLLDQADWNKQGAWRDLIFVSMLSP